MKILFLDSTNAWTSVRTLEIDADQASTVYSWTSEESKSASVEMVQRIADALSKSGWNRPDRVVALTGPGSFTGIRIGVSTARNLSQLWQIPVYGWESLESYSYAFYKKTGEPVAVALEGRQKKIYGAIYSDQGFSGSQDLKPADFLEMIEQSKKLPRIYTNTQYFSNSIQIGEEPNPEFIVNRDRNLLINLELSEANCESLLPNYVRGTYVETNKQS